jgi:hypothetical protein
MSKNNAGKESRACSVELTASAKRAGEVGQNKTTGADGHPSAEVCGCGLVNPKKKKGGLSAQVMCPLNGTGG